VQSLKQDLEIISTDEGREMISSEEQNANADSPRTERLEPGAKLKDERRSHDEKQNLESV
jgi:hypothetical protein